MSGRSYFDGSERWRRGHKINTFSIKIIMDSLKLDTEKVVTSNSDVPSAGAKW